MNNGLLYVIIVQLGIITGLLITIVRSMWQRGKKNETD